MARPVQPQRVLEGPIRVEMLLDVQGRYVLTSTSTESEDEAPHRAYAIVDWKSGTRCDLPEGMVRFTGPLTGATLRKEDRPLFALPIVLKADDAQTLQFVDEKCQVLGETEYGTVSSTMINTTLDEDGREVLIYGNGKGTIALADPWEDTRTEIATGVRRLTFVQRASVLSAPQMLWLLENGKLTQRTLDGTLVLSVGDMVTEFAQVLFGQLRVAYVDRGDLFEAVGPDFKPTRVAEAGCSPTYKGNTLELFRPCADRQLVRINLMTGEATEFDKGVFESYTDNGYHFEQSRDPMGEVHQWVEPPGRERVEITPPFLQRPLVLTATRLGGLKSLPVDEQDSSKGSIVTFVVQDVVQDLSTSIPLEGGISDIIPFNDNRTSSYLWLVQHNLRSSSEETPDHQIGDLSIFSERSLKIESVRRDVPVRDPLGGTITGVHGFSVETSIPFREPLIIVIGDAEPLSSDPKLSRGTLEARLLSGELGSTIAEDVTSYFLVTSPLPGVLYGVEEGDKPGLWFAAL